jgi:hypothetical protein
MTMTTLLAKVERFCRVTLWDKPLPEPEPAFEPRAREGRGLFALLTPEQRARALAHREDAPVKVKSA